LTEDRIAEDPNLIARRRAQLVALDFRELGVDPPAIERHLLRRGAHPAVAFDAARSAWSSEATGFENGGPCGPSTAGSFDISGPACEQIESLMELEPDAVIEIAYLDEQSLAAGSDHAAVIADLTSSA